MAPVTSATQALLCQACGLRPLPPPLPQVWLTAAKGSPSPVLLRWVVGRAPLGRDHRPFCVGSKVPAWYRGCRPSWTPLLGPRNRKCWDSLWVPSWVPEFLPLHRPRLGGLAPLWYSPGPSPGRGIPPWPWPPAPPQMDLLQGAAGRRWVPALPSPGLRRRCPRLISNGLPAPAPPIPYPGAGKTLEMRTAEEKPTAGGHPPALFLAPACPPLSASRGPSAPGAVGTLPKRSARRVGPAVPA